MNLQNTLVPFVPVIRGEPSKSIYHQCLQAQSLQESVRLSKKTALRIILSLHISLIVKKD